MTEPALATPESDLELAASLGRVQTVQLTLVLGTVSGDAVTVARPQVTADLAQAIRVRAQRWLQRVGERTAVEHSPGYRADESEIAALASDSNARARSMTAKLFPPQEVPALKDSAILNHADFLAVCVADRDRAVALVKRITASRVVLRPEGRKIYAILGANQTFGQVESPIVELDHSYHVLLSGDHVFFFHQEETERLLGFDEALQKSHDNNTLAIAKGLTLSDGTAFARLLGGSKVYRKKIKSALDRGIFKRPVAELASFAKSEGIPLTFSEVDGKLVLVVEETTAWMRALLAFLDEDFVNGGLSGDKYLANSKRKR